MKKDFLLKTPSEEDKKAFRAELNRCGIKVVENFEKILTHYKLTEEEVKKIDLTSKVVVFKNIIVDGVSHGVAMLTDNSDKLVWNRN